MGMFESKSRYFRVCRRDLVYLKFILEAYEGIALLSTVDSESAIVRVGYPFFFEEDIKGLMTALAGEIPLTEVLKPDGYSDGLPDIPLRKANRDA